MFDSEHISTVAYRKKLSASDLQVAIRSVCTNSHALVFFSSGDGYDSLLPCKAFKMEASKVCVECSSYYDEAYCQ